MSGTVLIAAAVVVAVVLLVVVLLFVRARSTAPRPLPSGPSSPTAIVCSFCKREYEPAETGGRCPGCGAAAPRRG